jgi:hypothetical protein
MRCDIYWASYHIWKCLEPPAEGKSIEFPRKHAILADCTTITKKSYIFSSLNKIEWMSHVPHIKQSCTHMSKEVMYSHVNTGSFSKATLPQSGRAHPPTTPLSSATCVACLDDISDVTHAQKIDLMILTLRKKDWLDSKKWLTTSLKGSGLGRYKWCTQRAGWPCLDTL